MQIPIYFSGGLCEPVTVRNRKNTLAASALARLVMVFNRRRALRLHQVKPMRGGLPEPVVPFALKGGGAMV